MRITNRVGKPRSKLNAWCALPFETEWSGLSNIKCTQLISNCLVIQGSLPLINKRLVNKCCDINLRIENSLIFLHHISCY